MSTDLIVTPEGEVFDLDATTDVLARYLYEVRDYEGRLREAKNLVTRELLNRMDKTASWTVRLEGLRISGQSPQPSEEWDGAELRTALLSLVDEGLLSIEAVDAAVEQIITFKPRKAGISKLRKLGGRVEETINELVTRSEKTRYISVSRSGE